MKDNVLTLPLSAPTDRRALESLVRVTFLRGIRARGWTVQQTARECFVSRQSVERWLSGKRRIPASAFAVVCGFVAANDREAA